MPSPQEARTPEEVALRFTSDIKAALLDFKARAEEAASTGTVRLGVAYKTLSDILDHAWDEVESVRDDLRYRQ